MGKRAARQARLLSLASLLGCGLYVVLDVVAQLLPPHYSPIHQAESDLAVGPYGFVMGSNFVVRGALTLCLVSALATWLPARGRSRAGIFALGVWGVTSALLAGFPTDILDDRHLVPHPHLTQHGEMHLALATLGFVAAAVGAVLVSTTLRRSPLAGTSGLPLALAILSVVGLVVLVVSGAVAHAGGLGERFFLAVVLAWTAVMATRVYRAAGMAMDGGGAARASP